MSLLFGRKTPKILGGIYPTLHRLEKAGRLTPVKLHPSLKNAKTFYRPAEILALARGERESAAGRCAASRL